MSKVKVNIRFVNLLHKTKSEAKKIILKDIQNLPTDKNVANCIMIGLPDRLSVKYKNPEDYFKRLLLPFDNIKNVQVFETPDSQGFSISEVQEITSEYMESLQELADEMNEYVDSQTDQD